MELRFGMVGGGNGAFIGDVHRHGALMDDMAVIKAGCFSRHEEKNLETGRKWHIYEDDRIYPNYKAMAEKEAAREDGIHFVIIATPNISHYEIAKCFLEHGIHVMCDKPLTQTMEQGLELQKLAKEKDLLFGLTYTYTGYALIRQAREMIRAGEIGDILHVVTEYPQDWLISSLVQKKSDQAPWRLDPKIIGKSLCAGDIGTHLEQLIVQSTGLKVKRVLARFDKYPRDLSLETNINVLLDFGNEITGNMWASQIAIGYECGVKIRIFGTKGAIEWCHDNMTKLKVTKNNEPVQYYSANREYCCEESRRLSRLPAGHPEAFFEAFGNIYHSYCEHLLAKLEGREPESYTFPTIEDGLNGMRFVDACVESNEKGNVWVNVE